MLSSTRSQGAFNLQARKRRFELINALRRKSNLTSEYRKSEIDLLIEILLKKIIGYSDAFRQRLSVAPIESRICYRVTEGNEFRNTLNLALNFRLFFPVFAEF